MKKLFRAIFCAVLLAAPACAQDRLITIEVGGALLTARLEDNSSAAALYTALQNGPLTVNMHDYGNFEKTGDLGFQLPRNDEHFATDAGDLILYQGSTFVIYYDKNEWTFTRLGKIEDIGKAELQKLLGPGNVTAVLRAKNP